LALNRRVNRLNILWQSKAIRLIRSDLINYDYIIKLLGELKEESLILSDDYQKRRKELLKQLDRDIKLRDKRELIEEFIDERLQSIPKDKIKDEFELFWSSKKEEKFKELAQELNIYEDRLKDLIREYEFRGKILNEDIENSLKYKLKILGRSKRLREIRSKILKFIELFEW